MLISKMSPDKFREILKAGSHWILVGSESAAEAFAMAQLTMITKAVASIALKIDYINATTHRRGVIVVLLIRKTAASIDVANDLVASIVDGENPQRFSDVQDIAMFPGTMDDMDMLTDFLMGMYSDAKVFHGPLGAN